MLLKLSLKFKRVVSKVNKKLILCTIHILMGKLQLIESFNNLTPSVSKKRIVQEKSTFIHIVHRGIYRCRLCRVSCK